jgi:hypothetical protein
MPMRLLVLTSEPITAQQLRNALADDADIAELEVMVVAPAVQASGLRFWMSDADEAIQRANEVRRQTVSELAGEGVAARGDTGESDPAQAIEDALQTFPAERIMIFRHSAEGQRYREDFDLDELRERFALPVAEAPVPG